MTDDGPGAIYDRLWRESVAAFREGRFETDPLIDDPDDARRGLSLVARFGEPVAGALAALRSRLAAVAPEQYLPHPDELHVTVLSIVTCTEVYAPTEMELGPYAELVGECLRDASGFDLDMRGLTASPSCVLVRGFPEDDGLERIRAALRDGFARSALHRTMEARYRARTAHATVLRLARDPADGAALLDALEGLRDEPFGRCRVDRLELVVNDWYHRRDRVHRVAVFDLAPAAERAP